MNRALYAAASGMAAQQRNLETISQNLANADVSGFKGSSLSFESIVLGAGTLGVSALDAHTTFKQGKLMRGDGAYDMAIDGEGFFNVIDANGKRAFTRNGEFTRDAGGTLRTPQGWRLEGVRIPADVDSVTIAEDGTVTGRAASGAVPCGRVRVTTFDAPEMLRSAGGTLFYSTAASGKPHDARPPAHNGPRVRAGMLEQSNVTIIEAMMEIMAAQRAYEADAKGVQAADEMMRIADNLQRG